MTTDLDKVAALRRRSSETSPASALTRQHSRLALDGVLADLQIARGYRLGGDPILAQIAYEMFLKRWVGADSDLPILREAQRELDALH
ncbi:MAG: hypothetical protein WA869_20065 [Alloacidobacterium sp.]